MNNNRGFIIIISLTIFALILFFILYLMHVSSLERMIINSTISSIQSSYVVEGKINIILNKDKYLDIIRLNLDKFFKEPMNTGLSSFSFALDEDDLSQGDTNRTVRGSIFLDYDKRIVLELKTKGTYNKITRDVVAKVTVLNELYELGSPIISNFSLDEKRERAFNEYMNFLQENMLVPNLDHGMYGLHAKDFEQVKIINDNHKRIVEYYRNDGNVPIKVEYFTSDDVFLLCKNNSKTPELFIINPVPSNKFKLSGVAYIEGNLIVENDFEFDGILIVNGNIIISPLAKATVNGIILHKGEDEIINYENIEVIYSMEKIRKYIVYLPKFIDLNIRNIKIY